MDIEVLKRCKEADCGVLSNDIYCPTHAPYHRACRVGRCNRPRARCSKYCDMHLYLKADWADTYCNAAPGCIQAADVEPGQQNRPCPDHYRCIACGRFAMRWENFCLECICQWPECSVMRTEDYLYCRRHKCEREGCPERRYQQPAVVGEIVEKVCYTHFRETPSSEWELYNAPYDYMQHQSNGY